MFSHIYAQNIHTTHPYKILSDCVETIKHLFSPILIYVTFSDNNYDRNRHSFTTAMLL